MFNSKIKQAVTCLIYIFFLYISPAIAQKEYTLIGTLTVGNGAAYSYKLQFSDSAGAIKGYSITDIGGPNQTKSTITGTINSSKKELTFRETNISGTKSPIPRDSFCFVHAKLKLAGMKKGHALKGSFTGYRPGGKAQCAKGSITLYSAADMLDKLMKLSPAADSILKPVKEKLLSYDTVHANVVPILPGKTYEAEYETATATIELWDDQHIDGDVISIKLNGNTILDKYALTAARKYINVNLSGGVDSIALVAVSEGSEPSNTAMLRLSAGGKAHYLKASSSLNQPVYIILKPKDR